MFFTDMTSVEQLIRIVFEEKSSNLFRSKMRQLYLEKAVQVQQPWYSDHFKSLQNVLRSLWPEPKNI
jgi:hypothetical protein